MRLGRAAGISLVLLLPACGEGGAPGSGAVVSTPAGVRHGIIDIDFALFDPESDAMDVAVEFSADGGATFQPATTTWGALSTAGLASSPSGIAHSYAWDSESDGVAIGTVAYGGPITSHGTVNSQVRIRVTPTGGAAGTTASFTVDNTTQRALGATTALFTHSFPAQGTQETALGNLVADAARAKYGTQLVLQNGHGLRCALPCPYFMPTNLALRRPDAGYAAGPPFDLTMGDLMECMPWGNRWVTRTVTGTQLRAALEWGVSYSPANHNGFPHISGFSFVYQASAPVGSRIQSVTLDGGAPIPADATVYTFTTNDFLNAGGDGYSMLNDGQGTTREIMVQVVAEYVSSNSPLTPAVSGRITAVP